MDFDLEHGIAILERTPSTLRAMLSGLPSGWIRAQEASGTWSPFDVVGHLIDGEETDWIPRARVILAPDGPRQFEPFDRFRHQELNRDRTLDELLERFARLRARNLETLRGFALTPGLLALSGEHPAFGPVTLSELLATWVAHDLDHIYQIARVMAAQYAVAVGPWKAYLRVVRDGEVAGAERR